MLCSRFNIYKLFVVEYWSAKIYNNLSYSSLKTESARGLNGTQPKLTHQTNNDIEKKTEFILHNLIHTWTQNNTEEPLMESNLRN